MQPTLTEVSPAGATRLTPAQAEALWRAWTTKKDSAARDRLILSYAPMVRYLASKKVRELPAHFELDDLVSCGLLALVNAVDRFDPVKGATFEQYAWTRITGAIVDELRRHDWASRSSRRLGREVEKVRDGFLAKEGRMPNEDELAGALKMEVTELRGRLEELDRAEIVSLNAPAAASEDSAGLEIGDTVETERTETNPELATLASERSRVLREAISSLSERERQILTLLHVHHMKGAEIGKMMGFSESRVSQILAGIRTKLRDRVAAYEADGATHAAA
jgi:RNA polymerase sigma factor for flagellar operon FliA